MPRAAWCGDGMAGARGEAADSFGAATQPVDKTVLVNDLGLTATPADPTCMPVRLDDPGGSMENVLPRDQGPYGICYAETAVQLVDAWRFGHGDSDTGRQTAVMSAAIGLSDLNIGKDPFNGGYSCDVVNFLAMNGGHDGFKVGMCMAKKDQSDPGAVARLGTLYDSYQGDLATAAQGAQGVPLDKNSIAALRWSHAMTAKADPAIAGLNLPANVLSDFFGYRRERFIFAIASYECFNADPPQPVDVPGCTKEIANTAPSSFYKSAIDARLNRPNAQPVEISYCSGVLTAGKAYPGADRTPASPKVCPGTKPDGSGGGAHSSLIVGRRPGPGGSCQYLVRNSWGASCSGGKRHALPGGPPLPTTAPTPHDIYSTDWDCDNGRGDIWIDAGSLLNSIFGVSYLNDGSPDPLPTPPDTAESQR